MKKTIFVICLLVLTSLSGLYAKQKSYNIKYQPNNVKITVIENNCILQTEDSIYLKPYYFEILYNHIMNNGRVEEIDASSRLDKKLYVEYHILSHNIWELKVDKTNRIYFAILQPEYKYYGSVLLTNDNVVKIECRDSSDTNKIYEGYNQFFKEINKSKNTPNLKLD